MVPTRRHVDIVYSAALRRVRDRHLAEEITQATFLILARKQMRAPSEAHLVSWLLTTVRYTALNMLRMEARRRRHQREAQRQMTSGSGTGSGTGSGMCSSDPSDVLAWSEVAPKLDDAVLALAAQDRAVVLMRFYESKSAGEIAAALGVSEAAVRQRLSRAVEKLRQRLARRGGADVAAGSLAALLGAHAVEAAPAAVANAALATVVTGTSSAAAAAVAKGAMTMMTWTKLKVATAVTALALAGGTGGTIYLAQVFGQSGGDAAAVGATTGVATAPATRSAKLPESPFVLPELDNAPEGGAQMLDLDGRRGLVTVKAQQRDDEALMQAAREADGELGLDMLRRGREMAAALIVVPPAELARVDEQLWESSDAEAIRAAMRAAAPQDSARPVPNEPFAALAIPAATPKPIILAYRTGYDAIGMIRLTEITPAGEQGRGGQVRGVLKLVAKGRPRNPPYTSLMPASRQQMKEWLEKRFAESYSDITIHRVLELGEPQSTPEGYSAVSFKYIGSFGSKDLRYFLSHRRYTFTAKGDFVRSDLVSPEVYADSLSDLLARDE